jgi:hypothetical protein
VRTHVAFAALALVASSVTATPQVDPLTSHIRCRSAEAQVLLATAVEQSPMVRAFVDEIEASDAIVYLDVLAAPTGEPYRGAMRFIAGTPQARYFLVEVDAWRSTRTRRVATLGHELWHVLEVARTPGVRDVADLKRFYQSFAVQWRTGHFETDGAMAAEAAILTEVNGGGWSHRPDHINDRAAPKPGNAPKPR